MRYSYMRRGFMLAFALVFVATACDQIVNRKNDNLQAFGVVEAVEVIVSPEIGGRVAEVFVSEGDSVQQGDPLFRLENDFLQAQRDQAVAAYESSLANLSTATVALEAVKAQQKVAQVNVDIASIQYELELIKARSDEQQLRITAWSHDVPEEFSLPVWYFDKAEEIIAAEAEVASARSTLDIERASFEALIQDISNADLESAEIRLAEAQAAFLVADELLNRDLGSDGKEELETYIQSLYDSAKAELEAAQSALEQLLSEQSATDVLEARARLAVARERYEIALDHLASLLTGDQSLSVRASEAGLRLAEANLAQATSHVSQTESSIEQAEKLVAQAQADLNLIDIQIEMLTVRAAIDSVVTTRNIEPGEVIQPGATALALAQLDRLTITVYIPEDRYGQISLGDTAQVTTDSFPNELFEAKVIRIADQAEYTPRNVQTEEDRRTTVFAIELSVESPVGKLKPGMPTNVTFQK